MKADRKDKVITLGGFADVLYTDRQNFLVRFAFEAY